MTIRKLDASEFTLVVDLFNQYRVYYQQEPNLALATSFIRERLENKESVIFVAYDEAQRDPLGFVQLYPTFSSVQASKNWILNDLFVAVKHRNKGIGEKLLKTAIGFAKEQRATSLQLETTPENKDAQRLYKRFGFVQQLPCSEYFLFVLPLRQ